MRILRYRWAAVLAVVGGVVAATPLAIWVVGDLSTAAAVEGPGYTPPPAPLSEGVILSGGIAGAILLLVVAAAIRGFPRTYTPFAMAVLAGGILGLSYRTWVADVIGANIGAGLVIILFLPVAGILLLAAAVSAYLVRPRPERVPGSPPSNVA